MEYNTVKLTERDAHMRKGIRLGLLVLWMAARLTFALGEGAPQIMWLDTDSGLDYAMGGGWTCTLETDTAGTVTVSVAEGTGSTVLLTEQVGAGSSTLRWDGLVQGRRLTTGRWELTVRLTDGEGRTSMAEVVSIEVTSPALATDESYHTPNEQSEVKCDHELCFWTLNMGEMDEAAIWKVLTQPVTVLEGSEREQVKVRKEPSEDCRDYVGEVTGTSQAVHVLRQEGDWTLVEAYSSSVEGSKVGVWALPFQGWVKTSLLVERQVDQHVGVVVDKLQQRMYIFRDGHLFSTLLCSTGYPSADTPFNETPAGEFLAVSWAGGFWSGSLYCDLAIRINDGILLHEVPCLIQTDESGSEIARDYDRCERYLGEKASHGCIRIQRQSTPEGVNARWLWDNLSRDSAARTKVMIWDEVGRVLGYPEDAVTLYYNPNGGKNYHSSATCLAVNEKFWPLTAFSYGELEDEPYAKLTPCPACAPQLRREAIDTVNAKNTR